MRFSQAQLGTRAERLIDFEIRGAPCSFAIRPLSGSEEAAVLSRATEYAKTKGADRVEPGNALFDLGIMVNALALACVDTESPTADRTPFWDGGASQIEANLDSEQITFLYARYELWQSECSPSQKIQTGTQLIETLVKIVEAEDDLPFVQARLGSLWTLLRITGRLCLASPELRSHLGSLYGTSGSDTKPETKKLHSKKTKK